VQRGIFLGSPLLQFHRDKTASLRASTGGRPRAGRPSFERTPFEADPAASCEFVLDGEGQNPGCFYVLSRAVAAFMWR